MVLRLNGATPDALEQSLKTQIARSPQFFANAPVVIDLAERPEFAEAVDFIELKRRLRALDLVPVGVQNATVAQQRSAAAAGLGAFTGPSSQRRAQSAAKRQEAPAARSLLVDQPVRSGTQIYARGGDLIVLKSVSAGAELIADGHIHVYGTLRGRALAGATGDASARIFVNRLEAELVSIAGHYLVSDHIGVEHHGKAAQIVLEEDHLTILAS